MTHYQIICRECDCVIETCRCMGKKHTSYSICDPCQEELDRLDKEIGELAREISEKLDDEE